MPGMMRPQPPTGEFPSLGEQQRPQAPGGGLPQQAPGGIDPGAWANMQNEMQRQQQQRQFQPQAPSWWKGGSEDWGKFSAWLRSAGYVPGEYGSYTDAVGRPVNIGALYDKYKNMGRMRSAGPMRSRSTPGPTGPWGSSAGGSDEQLMAMLQQLGIGG